MANAVQRHDGSWGAIDSRVVYRRARSAGFVYQAVLRSQLTRRLGVQWEPVDDRGIAELADVPVAARLVLQAPPSDRSGPRGPRTVLGTSGRGRTRTVKGEVARTDVLRARWRAEAADIGVKSGDVHRAVGRLGVGDALERVSVRQRRHVNDELLGPAGLTGQRTKLPARRDQPDVVPGDRRSAQRAPGRRRPGPRTRPAPLAERKHARRRGAHPRPGRRLPASGRGHRRRQRGATSSGNSTLSDEQQTMVTALARDGHHIDAVVGVAGSGKTYALAVAHRLWADAEYDVLGAATSKQAATQLQADSGITSGTLDSLLLHLDRPGAHLQAGSVVVDEAGMVPTRKLDELLGHCASGVKVAHRACPTAELSRDVGAGPGGEPRPHPPDVVQLRERRR
jgi:AAA domain/TrwC relaxase